MFNTFIGIAVKSIQKDIDFLEKKETRNGVLVGCPFEGDITQLEMMKAFLLANGHVRQEDIVGQYMFLGKTTNKDNSAREKVTRLYA